MELKNDKYKVLIKIDSTPYSVGSADNVIKYDVVLNPLNKTARDRYKTFYIEVQTAETSYLMALVGSSYSFDAHCAILDDDRLTVLQGEYILVIDLDGKALISMTRFSGWAANYELHRISNKYIVYGELSVTCLDRQFEQEWSYSGSGIITGFKIEGDRIRISCDGDEAVLGINGEPAGPDNGGKDITNEDRAQALIRELGFDFNSISRERVVSLLEKEIADYQDGSSEYIRLLCGYLYCLGDAGDAALIEKAKYNINFDVGCMIDAEWIDSLKSGGIEAQGIRSRDEIIDSFVKYYKNYRGE